MLRSPPKRPPFAHSTGSAFALVATAPRLPHLCLSKAAAGTGSRNRASSRLTADRRRHAAGLPRPAGARRGPRACIDFTLFGSNGLFLRLHRQLRRRRRAVRQRLPDPGLRRFRAGLHPTDAGQLLLPSGVLFVGSLLWSALLVQVAGVPPIRHRALRHPDDHGRRCGCCRARPPRAARGHDGGDPAARLRPGLPVPVDHPDRLRPARRAPGSPASASSTRAASSAA
jgi:hypothetical protein